MSVQFLLTALVVVLIPGTGVIYTLAIGLGRGTRSAIWAAGGCTLGIVPHLVAATLGLAAILHTSALLFNAVKFAGVAYLLWLAWSALQTDGAMTVTPEKHVEPGLKTAWRGTVINVLNPKLSIFFLALLPPFLSGNTASVTREMLALGAVFMALTFVVFVLYGVFAGAARRWILSSEATLRWLNRGFAGIFTALAGRLAIERV